MPTAPSAQARIAELQEQIELLKQTAILELKERRVALAQQLHEVDCELGRLTGGASAARKPRSTRSSSNPSAAVSLDELQGALRKAPNRTLSLRNSGFSARAVKALATASPGILRMGGKGAWPTVTLL